MYAFLIVIHIIASIFLIAVILLQAGRGGGLTDTFGGSQIQSLFGTRSATVLAKMTAICAAVFIITCLSLAIISSQRSRSLMEKFGIPVSSSQPATTTGAPVEAEKAQQPEPPLAQQPLGGSDEATQE